MTLREYLRHSGTKAAAFGRQIGVHNRMTILRYVKHERMPPRDVLLRIREATGGAVTADDFVNQHTAEAA